MIVCVEYKSYLVFTDDLRHAEKYVNQSYSIFDSFGHQVPFFSRKESTHWHLPFSTSQLSQQTRLQQHAVHLLRPQAALGTLSRITWRKNKRSSPGMPRTHSKTTPHIKTHFSYHLCTKKRRYTMLHPGSDTTCWSWFLVLMSHLFPEEQLMLLHPVLACGSMSESILHQLDITW